MVTGLKSITNRKGQKTERMYIKAPRYTKEAWIRCGNPASTWEENNRPYQFDIFCDQIMKSHENQPSIVCQIPIDDEYFAWLAENALPDSEESMNKYVSAITEERAFDLSKKHEYDGMCDCVNVYALRVFFWDDIEKKQYSDKLSAETVSELTKYLEKIFGDGNVYLPGYLVEASSCAEDNYKSIYRDMANIGISHFVNKVDVKINKYCNQDYSCKTANDNVKCCMVPFMVNHKICAADSYSNDKRWTTHIKGGQIHLDVETLAANYGVVTDEGLWTKHPIVAMLQKDLKNTTAHFYPETFSLCEGMMGYGKTDDDMTVLENKMIEISGWSEGKVVNISEID